MFGTTKTLGLSILFLGISGILHLIAPVLSGFSQEGLMLAPFGVLWLLIAAGLRRNAFLTPLWIVIVQGGIIPQGGVRKA